ncbi:prohibitin family protein [Aquimarina sp. AD10]|uniref:Peptidase n=1 Tax=Aquimarina aggregata TaxID=1642818 RepID=A0A163CSF0_9FLAO|nr:MULTISPECIES: prohibitin family protein [Aquimarina]AXT63600.1 prohibitin family protein [Aquimarina sp. AD10]KZS42720.1 peptidase [Aquimarina aggregata]RKM97705.1 prohibitin family protein [Aquimarina sp. AD10]
MERLPKIGLPILIIIVLLIVFISKASVNIGYGEAGVLFKTFGGGVVTDEPALGEGFHIIAPWNKVYVYNTKQQEVFEKKMQVLSSNGLEISLDVSVLYQPKMEKLGLLHQTKGEDYLNIVIVPEIRAVARSVVGRYTPEQLYSTKRDAIQNEIFEETKKKVDGQYVQLNAVLVRDVTLPIAIKEAIERKLKQEQESLEYEFRIEKAKKEAERQRIDAEGKAAANTILSASLTDKILKEKGIEATLELSKSPNAKVIVVGSGKDGMPLILGNQ